MKIKLKRDNVLISTKLEVELKKKTYTLKEVKELIELIAGIRIASDHFEVELVPSEKSG